VFDLIQIDRVIGAVIELGRARRVMVGYLLLVHYCTTILQAGSGAGCLERVAVGIVLLSMFVLTLVLGACAPMPASAPAFPTGKFLLEGAGDRALQFNEDGTFAALLLPGDVHLAEATYSVKGDVFTETSNNQGCITNRNTDLVLYISRE
jgi:hypothetical protein